jgi:hypothetical protein
MEWRRVETDDPPKEVRFDIRAGAAENSPYFSSSQDRTEVPDNLVGLAAAPKVWIGWLPAEELHAGWTARGRRQL